ncbi:MAG TPA: hypothetical protein VNC40_09315 [Gaiellaceae bacterium]|nr:hypothetical protein [Gaiellaceae bacterium]
MNLREHREHLALRRSVETYLDGEAAPDVEAAVARHLEVCWTCSCDAEWLTMIKSALVQIDRRRPPELSIARLHRFASSLVDSASR